MSIQIKKPLALIGENSNNFIVYGLREHGFEVLLLPADERLAHQVSSHADMLIFKLDDTVFCDERYYEQNKNIFLRIEEYGYTVNHSRLSLSADYPNDVALNQAVIGKSILGRAESCAKSILKYADSHKYTYHAIKQGYAKCSTLILNESAIISADLVIISIAKDLNASTLQIENKIGNVRLDGYDYGFIGGASAVYENKAFFFGNHLLHSQGDMIDKFCRDCGFLPISLGQESLCDIGGAIILPYVNKS